MMQETEKKEDIMAPASAKPGGDKKSAKPGTSALPLTQYGALPYRRCGQSLGVLLVTSRESKRWIIPKGWPEAKMAPHEVAAMEALEEAGVTGVVDSSPIGAFTYTKKLKPGKSVICEVTVFPLLVENELDTWREASQRERRWMTPEDAAAVVQEPELVEVLRLVHVLELVS